VEPLDLFQVARLDFEKPDFERFPCLAMAYESLRIGGTATTALNAANEVAVDAFLNKQLRFTHIARVIEQTLQQAIHIEATDLATVLQADKDARSIAHEWVKQLEIH
jgi:1-deoxy-D-xylulose-5-phosphate reductoisomerase